MSDLIAALVTDSIWKRLIGFGLFVVVGWLFFSSGRENVRAHAAGEKSPAPSGPDLARVGRRRMIMGAVCIAFGVFYLAVGPFLVG